MTQDEKQLLDWAWHTKMPFGKYRGRTLAQLAVDDLGYLKWMRDALDEDVHADKSLLRQIVTVLKAME